jgi:Fe-S-cluster containining protein
MKPLPTFVDEPVHEALRAELLALYDEVDQLLAPFGCAGTAECCNFANTGREPYPTAIELAEMNHAMRAGGVSIGRAKNALRGPARGKKLPLAGVDRTCALLSRDGRCRIYASRPFGCRTYFCDRRTGPNKLPRDDVQSVSRRIADLSARFDPRDPGPRPLEKALG